ncbi:CrcB family protein [uncultured Deefgea sp.]|uniref:fluoride efflux transporter FluC n=1 Tax=uncultured Deefgea sp. TaxID=1304914 RepID=UPI002604B53C|nr:CrcB family protein [uncultured Deefgea sp.]
MVSALDVMWVGLGGGLGSLARWRVGLWVGERYHGVFPLGTLLINVSGAFVIAYLSILFSIDWRERFGTPLNAGVLTGALGGFTTFSTMQLDAAKLTDSGQGKMAAVYLLLSVFAGLLAAILGAWLALLSR